jgi:hypothetical protein
MMIGRSLKALPIATLASVATLILALGSLAANCVDGATPDCSDAEACGTGVEGGLEDTSHPLPEASADTSTTDTGTDAKADASDAGDAG